MIGKRTIGKRGVSPLIATILLIVFAMVLGIIVMNVGGSYLALEEEKGTQTVNIMGIIDKCVSAGAITPEEGNILTGSLK